MHGHRLFVLPALVAVAILLGVMPGRARAGIVALGATTDLGGGETAYNYMLILSGAEEVVSGDFFTIYDFNGLLGGSESSAWTATTQLVTPTPPPDVTLAHGDSPTIENVTFTYQGTSPILGSTTVVGFQLLSSISTPTSVKDAAVRDTIDLGPNAGSFTDSVNDVYVPTIVPEPASLGVLGVIGLAALARRRRAI